MPTWSKSDLANYEAKRNRPIIRPVEAGVVEHPAALERKTSKQQGGKRGLAVVVSLVACVRKEYDSDNLYGAIKPLRDAIAATLGLDDADKRIRWEYAQSCTRGQTGVIVKIEILTAP